MYLAPFGSVMIRMTNVDVGSTNSSEGSDTFDIAGDGGVHITARSSDSQGGGEGEEGDHSAEGLWYAILFYIEICST